MEDLEQEQVIIIGGGPAGLTAAIYNARAGLNPLVINGPQPGGQITTTSTLENFPGFPEGIGGFEYIQKVTKQAQKFGARLIYESVESVDFKDSPYRINTGVNQYQTESVIIATGASPSKLGLAKEKELVGNGVSYCATCDGALFRDKEVAVVGGGNVALEEAEFLTKFAKKVHLIHRRDQLRGVEVLQERVQSNSNIEILWDSEVKSLIGDNQLQGLVVENNKTGTTRELKQVRGLFVAIGYIPNTDMLDNNIQLNDQGYIITNSSQETNCEGVFAAGDVQDAEYRQVITASASGAKAAMEVYNYFNDY